MYILKWGHVNNNVHIIIYSIDIKIEFRRRELILRHKTKAVISVDISSYLDSLVNYQLFII